MRSALLLLALACGGSDGEEACIFDGPYEIGFIPTNGCGAVSQRIEAYGMEDECFTSIDQISNSGARQRIFVTCEPGDPVVECSGFANDSDGCTWDVYMRRLTR